MNWSGALRAPPVAFQLWLELRICTALPSWQIAPFMGAVLPCVLYFSYPPYSSPATHLVQFKYSICLCYPSHEMLFCAATDYCFSPCQLYFYKCIKKPAINFNLSCTIFLTVNCTKLSNLPCTAVRQIYGFLMCLKIDL